MCHGKSNFVPWKIKIGDAFILGNLTSSPTTSPPKIIIQSNEIDLSGMTIESLRANISVFLLEHPMNLSSSSSSSSSTQQQQKGLNATIANNIIKQSSSTQISASEGMALLAFVNVTVLGNCDL